MSHANTSSRNPAVPKHTRQLLPAFLLVHLRNITPTLTVKGYNPQHTIILLQLEQPHYAEMEHTALAKVDAELVPIMGE